MQTSHDFRIITLPQYSNSHTPYGWQGIGRYEDLFKQQGFSNEAAACNDAIAALTAFDQADDSAPDFSELAGAS